MNLLESGEFNTCCLDNDCDSAINENNFPEITDFSMTDTHALMSTFQ